MFKMLPIKGLQKTSLIDYPPYTSCVVFIGGCNFRCPYCHNADMVVGSLPDISEDEFSGFLEERKAWLDAVVITGGEPTLYDDLLPFIESIKASGFKVKLDTNGTNPKLLEKILPMLDFISMDIKASKVMYEKAAKAEVIMKNIEKSIALLRDKAKDYEFRTTIVPEFYTPEIANEIGAWLTGSKRYVLQQYRAERTLDPDFSKNVYSKNTLEGFKQILDKHFDEVVVRGV